MKIRRIAQDIARIFLGRKRSREAPVLAENAVPPEVKTDDRYVLGHFSAPEFKAFSSRLQSAGVEFEVECDTSAPPINDQGMYFDRHPIKVLVRSVDSTGALELKRRWLSEIGHIEEEKAEPGATDNPDDAQRLREDH